MGRASNGTESGAPPKPSWGATDRKKAKKRHLTEGMTEETLTDLTVLVHRQDFAISHFRTPEIRVEI